MPTVSLHHAGLDTPSRRSTASIALKNIQTIVDLSRKNRRDRSWIERLTDAVTAAAGSARFVGAHIILFGLWIGVNVEWPLFDPYPFNFLTFVVSLEAIILTGFVLMAQTRMNQQADERAHLDLQVNLLAEEELTAILKVLCLVAEKTGVDLSACDPRLNQLLDKTDVKGLASELTKELASVDEEA